jgi:DNA-binding transcriptional LysR family regulator
MLDIRHLRHAIGLANHGNYARAAEALHLTQPALTRSIQNLEQKLGVRLFDRSRRGVEPTEFGTLLLRHAQDMELAVRDLERDIGMAKGLEIGTLDIGAGPWGAASIVGVAVGLLSQRYPRLRVRVLIAPWQELPARIRAREIDLMVSDVSEVQGQEALEITPLMPHRAFVVCRPDHPLMGGRPLAPADIFRYPLAGPHLPQHAIEKMLRLVPVEAREHARSRGLLAITCDSSSVLKAILANSDAISIMSPFMCLKELKSGDLAMLPALDLGVQGQFGVTRLRDRTPSAPATAFIDMLVEHDRRIVELEHALLASFAGSSKPAGRRKAKPAINRD